MNMFSRKPNQASAEEEVLGTEAEEVVEQEVAPPVVTTSEQASSNGYYDNGSRSNISKPSIISEGFVFEGTITSVGVLNISGTVRGKITAKSVLVDASGQVDGELNSEQLVIKGQVKGDVICEDLNIGPLAHVDGNISYKYIHIQRGGKVAGKFLKS